MDKYGSFIFYISLFGVSALSLYKADRTKEKLIARGYAIIGLLIPVVIATLRYRVGVDYNAYVESAMKLSRIPLADFLTGKAAYFEPTMYFVSKLTFAHHNHGTLFFGVYAAITSVFMYLAARKYSRKNSWLIMLMYLLVLFSPSLNAVRQFASIAVTFYAGTFITKSTNQSWRKYGLFMILACLFHNSAIIPAVMLPVLALISRNDSKKSRIRLTTKYASIAVLIYAFVYRFYTLIPYIPYLEKYATFIYDANILANNPPNPLVKIVPILVSLLFFNKLKQLDDNFAFYYLVSFIALALSLSGSFIPQGYRLADYFTPYYLIIFSSLPDLTKRYKFVYISFIFSYALIYFTYSIFINNSYMTLPYHWILGARL